VSIVSEHDPVRKKDVYEKCTCEDVAIAYLSIKSREMGTGYKMKPSK